MADAPPQASPRKSRHRFAHSLSELPASLRLRRHGHSQSQSQSQSQNQNQNQNQNQQLAPDSQNAAIEKHNRHLVQQDTQGQALVPTASRNPDQSQSQNLHLNQTQTQTQAGLEQTLSQGQGQGPSGQAMLVRPAAAGRDRDTRDKNTSTASPAQPAQPAQPVQPAQPGSQDGRGASRQVSGRSAHSDAGRELGTTGASGNGDGRPLSTASSTVPGPSSPSRSPRLSPLAKSRTAGTTGTTGTTGTMATTGTSGTSAGGCSAPASLHGPGSVDLSPNSSRRPSVRTSKEYADERAQQGSHDVHDPPTHREHRHHHHHYLHRRHHHGHHHTPSMASHPTTVVALAAAATALAPASSPTGPNMGNLADGTAGDRGAGGDDAAERKVSAMSGVSAVSGMPGAPGTSPGDAATAVALSSIDAAAVAAAAATLARMQRNQSRQAARVLQTTVADIETLSSDTSQRLDAAYNSIIGRVGALQDTVLALRSLADAAQETNQRFASEAEAIADETEQHVRQLEGDDDARADGKEGKDKDGKLSPDDQQARLQQLSERVRAGRHTIQDLVARMDAVRTRVDQWERGDRAWQERTRKRLVVVWVVVVGVVVAGLIVLCVAMRMSGDAGAEVAVAGPDGRPGPPDLTQLANPSSPSAFHISFPNATKDGEDASSGDELQHLFDEL